MTATAVWPLDVPRDEAQRVYYSQPFTVYRHYDATGILLYVGMTADLHRRTLTHLSQSPWRDQIDRVEAELLPNFQAASVEEYRRIRSDGPLYNVVGSSDRAAAKARRKSSPGEGSTSPTRITSPNAPEPFVTTPDGEEGTVCSGRRDCMVPVHVHGCYADLGACDAPHEHEVVERQQERPDATRGHPAMPERPSAVREPQSVAPRHGPRDLGGAVVTGYVVKPGHPRYGQRFERLRGTQAWLVVKFDSGGTAWLAGDEWSIDPPLSASTTTVKSGDV